MNELKYKIGDILCPKKINNISSCYGIINYIEISNIVGNRYEAKVKFYNNNLDNEDTIENVGTEEYLDIHFEKQQSKFYTFYEMIDYIFKNLESKFSPIGFVDTFVELTKLKVLVWNDKENVSISNFNKNLNWELI